MKGLFLIPIGFTLLSMTKLGYCQCFCLDSMCDGSPIPCCQDFCQRKECDAKACTGICDPWEPRNTWPICCKQFCPNPPEKVHEYPEWMSDLCDNKRINEISIPGTHETMSHDSQCVFIDGWSDCQNFELDKQLKYGIRAIDIRAKRRNQDKDNKYFSIYHGPCYLGYNFGAVMKILVAFLKENPSEFVLMRLDQLSEQETDDEEFTKIFDGYWNDKDYNDYFYKLKDGDQSYIPLVEEARGKIVLLQNWKSVPKENAFGLDYSDIITQDYYNLSDGEFCDQEGKIDKIKEFIKETVNEDFEDDKVSMNYLSGYCIPWKGPNIIAEEINKPIYEYIEEEIDESKSLAITMMDYPFRYTPYLVDRIIDHNDFEC